MASFNEKIRKRSATWHKHRHGGGWINPAFLPPEKKKRSRSEPMFESIRDLFKKK